MTTKVKICGITNLEDALVSAKFGADALGFNFYAKSPRYIEPEKAREIIERLPKEILKVGVFVNESLDKIAEIARTAKLDALQLHGEESPEFARELKAKTDLEIIKAFRVSPEFKPEDVLLYDTDAILLDAYNPKMYGGTGETLDKQIARKVKDIFPKMYLAGGLNLENVAYSIDGVFPYYVDVCSGLEHQKGIKDRVKLINFLKIVKYEKGPHRNIYDFCWEFHPNLRGGIRISFDKLSQLELCMTFYLWGLTAGSKQTQTDTFFGKFYKTRIDRVSGQVVESVPENHLSFEEFLSTRYDPPRRSAGWVGLLIRTFGDNLDALYNFYALLEEYRIDYENDFND